MTCCVISSSVNILECVSCKFEKSKNDVLCRYHFEPESRYLLISLSVVPEIYGFVWLFQQHGFQLIFSRKNFHLMIDFLVFKTIILHTINVWWVNFSGWIFLFGLWKCQTILEFFLIIVSLELSNSMTFGEVTVKSSVSHSGS